VRRTTERSVQERDARVERVEMHVTEGGGVSGYSKMYRYAYIYPYVYIDAYKYIYIYR